MTDQEKIAALEAQLGMVAECYRHAMDTYDDLFEYGLDAILSTVKKPLAVKDVAGICPECLGREGTAPHFHCGYYLCDNHGCFGVRLVEGTVVVIEKEGE